jgi:7-cyano-7-deazaguanine synthase
MDSLVSAAIAHRDCDELFFLHISYGQRTEAKERWCFEQLARHYHAVEARVVDYHWLSAIGGSALTDPNLEIPEGITRIQIPMYLFVMPPFLCCCSMAEVIKATRIYIGAVEEDSSGYPDCRKAFLRL